MYSVEMIQTSFADRSLKEKLALSLPMFPKGIFPSDYSSSVSFGVRNALKESIRKT